MAVFRITSFTKHRNLAKKSIRYIAHRRGRDGKSVTRQLFGREGSTDKTEAYAKIDKAPRGTTFFRMIISPDPLTEDTLQDLDLREIMDQTMLVLQKNFPKQQVEYFAAIHADHTDKRHVHVVALLRGRLTKNHLSSLRATATKEALSQRQTLDREQGIIQPQHQSVEKVVHRREPRSIPVFVSRQPQRVDTPTPQAMPARASTSFSQGRQSAVERLELNIPRCPVCKSRALVREGSRQRCVTCGLSVEAPRSLTAKLKAQEFERELFLEEVGMP
jgi:hypothetical protein